MVPHEPRERRTWRWWAWFRDLPELTQVILGAGALFFTFLMTLAVIAYWEVLLRGAAITGGTVLILGLLAAAARGAARLRRRRSPAAHRAAHDRVEMAPADGRGADRAPAMLEEQEAEAARERAELLQAIAGGSIEALRDAEGFVLRNSEALWHRCPATMSDRQGFAGTGQLYVTSLRVAFVSTETPIEISIGHINAIQAEEHEVSVIGKSSGTTQVFAVEDGELAAAYILRSVRAFHRQFDVGFEKAGRAIPQDVKTSVWQRDGGRCVRCGARDYLEFDHIIPYSRGGANTVDNLQLLCRRCNQKKGATV